jgi:hypothetical protein
VVLDKLYFLTPFSPCAEQENMHKFRKNGAHKLKLSFLKLTKILTYLKIFICTGEDSLVGHAYGDKPLLADDELDLEEEGKPVLLEHKGEAAYWFNNNSSSANVFDMAPFQRPRKGLQQQPNPVAPKEKTSSWHIVEEPSFEAALADKDLFGSSPFRVAPTNPFKTTEQTTHAFYQSHPETNVSQVYFTGATTILFYNRYLKMLMTIFYF